MLGEPSITYLISRDGFAKSGNINTVWTKATYGGPKRVYFPQGLEGELRSGSNFLTSRTEKDKLAGANQ